MAATTAPRRRCCKAPAHSPANASCASMTPFLVRRANLSCNLALGLTLMYPETPIRGRHWKDFGQQYFDFRSPRTPAGLELRFLLLSLTIPAAADYIHGG